MKLTLDAAQTIVSLNLEKARETAKYDHRTSEYWPTLIGERLWFLNTLNNIDAVSIKHGRWVKTYDSFHCSVCGNKTTTYYRTNYCPNCGAKMDRKDDEEQYGNFG